MPINYINNDGLTLNGVKFIVRPYPPNTTEVPDAGLGSQWIDSNTGLQYLMKAGGWSITESASDPTVNALDYGVKGDGVTDDTAALQAAINATPIGGTLLIPVTTGPIRISAPIQLLEQRSYVFTRYMMWTYRYSTDIAATLKATAGFTGAAMVQIQEKTITGRALDADGIRLVGCVADAGAASGNVHGFLIEGLCRDLLFQNCVARDAKGTGSGWEFRQGTGTSPPRGIRMDHCVSDSGDRYGFRFNGVTDSTLFDLLAVGSNETGIYASNSGENTFDSCRAVFNTFHGFQFDGNTSTGLTTLLAPATDRNGRDGIRISQTGTQPIDIVSPRLRRDGSSSTSSNYAGISILGSAGNTVVPVNVIGGSCVPGVDDGGGGLQTPQYGIRATYAQKLNVQGGDFWGITAGINDGGNNTLLTYDPLVYFSSGAIGSKTRQATQTAGRAALGMIIRQELGSMPGELSIQPAPARWYNDTGFTVTLSSLRASVGSAPLGGSVSVDVRLNGVSQVTLTVTAGSYTSSIPGGTISVPDGGYVDTAIIGVGSTAPGADLTVSARAAW